MLTDPVTGALLDYGHTRYTPPEDLAAFVTARDRTCRFPTCTWPASRSDLDHSVPWPNGPTSPANLGALHRRHHNGKTHHRWRLSQPEPGRFTWTSPAGLIYDVEPEPVGPILEPDDPDRPPDDPDPPPDDDPAF